MPVGEHQHGQRVAVAGADAGTVAVERPLERRRHGEHLAAAGRRESAPTITESFGPTTTAGPPQPPSRMLLAALNCPIGGPDSPVATIDGLAFPRIVVWVSEPPLARIAGPALSTK